MNIHPQFTYDKNGNPIGVFLSIEEWEEVSSELHLELPQWQKDALQVELTAVKEGRAVLTDYCCPGKVEI